MGNPHILLNSIYCILIVYELFLLQQQNYIHFYGDGRGFNTKNGASKNFY